MGEEKTARPPRIWVPDLAEQLAAYGEKRGTRENREIGLKREEKEHVRARRLRDGDDVVAIDGMGLRLRGTLARSGSVIQFALSPSKDSPSSSSALSSLPGEPANRIVVALACGEPARVEWAVEKGTECGAAGFALLACDRSQRSHVAALSSAARLARLRRIAVEATKQCDRTIVPFVEGPKRTGDFLRGLGLERLLIADPGASFAPEAPAPPRADSLRSDSARVRREGPGPLLGRGGDSVVAIGPEGGFTPSELARLAERSPVFLSLGPRILRLETAVVAALCRLVDGS